MRRRRVGLSKSTIVRAFVSGLISGVILAVSLWPTGAEAEAWAAPRVWRGVGLKLPLFTLPEPYVLLHAEILRVELGVPLHLVGRALMLDLNVKAFLGRIRFVEIPIPLDTYAGIGATFYLLWSWELGLSPHVMLGLEASSTERSPFRMFFELGAGFGSPLGVDPSVGLVLGALMRF